MKKYKLTRNLGLKIMAFVSAVFLWVIVANVDNPITRDTYTEIPVEIVNDDIILQGGEVYSVLNGDSVSVVVYAKRSVLQDINADDIVATADIAEMDTHTGLVPIDITIPNYNGDYQSAEAVPRNLQIQTEPTAKAEFSLVVRTTGDQRDGYTLGDMKVNPERITLTGAESKIKQIDSAVARVDVSGMSQSEEKPAELVLYDESGGIISQSQLSNNLGEDGITVYVEVLEQKSVPLVFNVSGTPAEGYQFTECTSAPESILVYGSEEALAEVDEINIPASEINIDGASERFETNVDIRPYLPEGVNLVEDTAGDIVVTVSIEKEGTRTIDVLVASVKINNLTENLQVTYEPDAEVSLTFRGDQDTLDALDISNAVFVNLQAYTQPGTYDIPVLVDVPEGVTLAEDTTIKLTLEEKENTEVQEEQGQEDQNG